MSDLLAEGRIRVYLSTDGKSDQQIDRLIDKHGPEVEAALEHALEALAGYLTKQFPKGLLTIKVEEE
jgi:hypothetical protein